MENLNMKNLNLTITKNPSDSVYDPVDRFSDYGVRVNDKVEFMIPNDNDWSYGYISELRKDQITVKLYENGQYVGDMSINKNLFNEIDLQIYNEYRGSDNDSIGMGCYENWENVWY